ncbi:MAG: DUF4159 domain-containing protein [Pseudomonadota bacterium]
MLTFGTLAFLQPLFLAALLALPILWLLLRAVPPAPKRERFPGVRILIGLDDRERTPQRTPWWLLLLRLIATAFLIFAFADPVLNPKPRLGGSGPLLVVMDGGWASGSDWADRREAALDFIDQAAAADRPVSFQRLSDPTPAPEQFSFQTADAAGRVVAALDPLPWAPDHTRLDAAIEAAESLDAIYLHDGLDHPGATDLADRLAAKGPLRMIGPAETALALAPPRIEGGDMTISVLRAETGDVLSARLAAFGAAQDGGERRIAFADAELAADTLTGDALIELPLELRNAVARIAIAGQPHAGAVQLFDDRWKRRSVALVSGERGRGEQPLLEGLTYLRAALAPHASYQEAALEDALELNVDVIILADIGRIDVSAETALLDWVESGGLLIRFAGPQLAAAVAEQSRLGRLAGAPQMTPDPLLPTTLRGGGRALGGALSWGAPQGLRPFPQDSPFADLAAPTEVTVSRQVLAEPGPELSERIWASLADGTPLVTAAPVGDGRIALFHVTASPAWSSLPLSGLFVEMMGRLVAAAPALAGGEAARAESVETWRPERVLDGYGRLEAVGDDAAPVDGATLANGVAPGIAPGVYSPATEDVGGASLAVNLITSETILAPRAAPPAGVFVETLTGTSETPLKPWLLTAAMALLLLDILAALFVAGRLRRSVASLVVGVILAAGVISDAPPAFAQSSTETTEDADLFAVDPAEKRAALETVLGFVTTGDPRVDRISEAGLLGLSATLNQRTAIEPGEPAAVDIEADELALFAILYWPITATQPELSDAAVRRMNAFMRSGGLLIIDTRDTHETFGSAEGPNARNLRRLVGRLDLPPLEQTPPDHVLTRSFYLIDALPGRWYGGPVWVEAAPQGGEDGQTVVNANDGVSPVIIGGHDWAGAWALDEQGAPLFPMGRGGERQREIAYRFGVNAAMYAFTGNYKSDQVHLPALLERLGN